MMHDITNGLTGFLHLVNTDLSSGDFHVLVGMLMVFPAVALFLGAGWVLDNLFLEADGEGDHEGDSIRAENPRETSPASNNADTADADSEVDGE